MAYDAAKDQILKSWENEETGLTVSIYRYADGDPKLQIGPRTYTKRDGARGTTKPGRLSIDDVLWLIDILDEVKKEMSEFYLDENS
jgi:hypothetical protein